MEKPRYGSPEYSLEKAKEEIDKALSEISKMRIEAATIKPIEKIVFGGWPKARIEGNPNNNPSDFVVWSYYSSFDSKNEEHIKRSVQAVNKWIESARPKIETWHQENLPNIENNVRARESAINFMKLLGIPSSYSSYEYPKGRAKTGKTINHLAGFLSDLDRCCKIGDGYHEALTALTNLERRTKEWSEKYLLEIQKIKKEKEKTDKQVRILAKAMEVAAKHNFSSDSNDELISWATERAEEDFRLANYPDGTSIDQSCCSECSEWEVGEHRCSCGNRRMNLVIEGNLVDGFSAYPEAY